MASSREGRPLPPEFLDWQVHLRAWTMEQQHGAPHAGVAPLVLVRAPGVGTGTSVHSIICGILPRADLLLEKTKEFKELYESSIAEGARALYDKGIAYLKRYYASSDVFDRASITTLLAKDSPVVRALRADATCALVFYVFDLRERGEVGRFRCLQLCCRADVLEDGPVYENVWWHNTLFHGKAEDHVVIHFKHEETFDTRFGRFDRIAV
jgi:hypothetical protein